MLTIALEYVKNQGSTLSDHASYVRTTDWTKISKRKDREGEYRLHADLAKSFQNKLEYILTEVSVEEIEKSKQLTDFKDTLLKEITTFTKRCHKYLHDTKLESCIDADDKAAEVAFQNTVLDNMMTVKKNYLKLPFFSEDQKVVLDVYAGQVLPLQFRKVVEDLYPEVERHLKGLK